MQLRDQVAAADDARPQLPRKSQVARPVVQHSLLDGSLLRLAEHLMLASQPPARLEHLCLTPARHLDCQPSTALTKTWNIAGTFTWSQPATNDATARIRTRLLRLRGQLRCVPYQFIHTASNDPERLPFWI